MKLPESATQTFYVHLSKYPRLDGSGAFELWLDDMSEFERVCLGPVEITFSVPQDVDPIQAQVDSLEKQLAVINREYAQKVSTVQTRIKELQALTYEPV